MDENEQEIIYKLSLFEQQMNHLQQQLNAVEKAVVDMGSLTVSLEDLKDKKDKEIFASIGRGIYIKAKLISEDLMVDIGDRTFVNKKIPETQELINSQVEKLKEVKEELISQLQEMDTEMVKLVEEAQKNSED